MYFDQRYFCGWFNKMKVQDHIPTSLRIHSNVTDFGSVVSLVSTILSCLNPGPPVLIPVRVNVSTSICTFSEIKKHENVTFKSRSSYPCIIRRRLFTSVQSQILCSKSHSGVTYFDDPKIRLGAILCFPRISKFSGQIIQIFSDIYETLNISYPLDF